MSSRTRRAMVTNWDPPIFKEETGTEEPSRKNKPKSEAFKNPGPDARFCPSCGMQVPFWHWTWKDGDRVWGWCPSCRKMGRPRRWEG